MARSADAARVVALIALAYGVAENPVTLFVDRLVRVLAPLPFRSAVRHATTCSYVFRAYPLWLLAHPTQDCPAGLDELGPFTRYPELFDPGTAPYVMRCDPRMHRITVWSDDDLATAASNARTIEAQSCRFGLGPWGS